MKTKKRVNIPKRPLSIILFFAYFVCIAEAADIASHEIINRLLSMSEPGAPEIVDDAVIFTHTSNSRRAGVAFAHEGFSRVHWLRLLMIPQDPLILLDPAQKNPNPYKDSGILFYIHPIPEDLQELEYRLIIDGLWTVDPVNPISRRNNVTGLEYSVLPIPVRYKKPEILRGPQGTLNFSFQGPPGETITVAGSFNGWDPFMYEMKEGPAGTYSFTLPLPPGRYQYIFFHRGERQLDPYNPNRAYTRDGKAASEVVIE